MKRRLNVRRGFALAAVLWVLTVAAVLGASTALVGRSAYGAARNRVNAERAYWLAEACLAAMRSLADHALFAADPSLLTQIWRSLDRNVAAMHPPLALRCQVSLTAVGSSIDINGSSDVVLRKFFLNATGTPTGDALTDALLDWRDPDDDQRALGAERSWYDANGQQAPRNDSLASVRELALVRGMASHHDLWPYLTVERSRICLTTAPGPVLAALPGFVDETVVQLLSDRAQGLFFSNLNALQSELSSSAADSLQAHFPELAALTTADPDGWMLTVRARAGLPPVAVTTEVRLDRFAGHTVILRRRTQ